MNVKKSDIVYNVSDLLRSSFPYEEYTHICVYCVFIKYIIDNKKVPLDDKSFSLILDLQRMFDRHELKAEALIAVSLLIEEAYNFPSSSLVDFANTYIRFTSIPKSYDISSNVLNELSKVSFENSEDELIESLQEALYKSSRTFGRIMGENISNKSLSDLIGTLLNINDSDCFADLAFGVGMSTLEITKNKKCSIWGCEINRSIAAVAKMLLIIAGKENYSLIVDDVLQIDLERETFDKLAIMPPLGLKIRELETSHMDLLSEYNLPGKQTTCDTLFVLKAISSLGKTGTAVVAVSPSLLFSATVLEKEFRKLLVSKYLDCVIQLPSLYNGTSIQTILLILKKHVKDNRDIVLIDASNNETFKFSTKENDKSINITKEGIEKLKNVYYTKQSLEGISVKMNIAQLEEDDYLLTPSRYIQPKSSRVLLTTREIDEKLNKLYEQLRELMEVKNVKL